MRRECREPGQCIFADGAGICRHCRQHGHIRRVAAYRVDQRALGDTIRTHSPAEACSPFRRSGNRSVQLAAGETGTWTDGRHTPPEAIRDHGARGRSACPCYHCSSRSDAHCNRRGADAASRSSKSLVGTLRQSGRSRDLTPDLATRKISRAPVRPLDPVPGVNIDITAN